MTQNAQPRFDRAAGQVFFVLGLARAGGEHGLPGPALIALLSDLGLSESAARAAILRLRRHGWVSSTRRGRQTLYAAAPATISHQRRFQDHFTETGPPWDGFFHGLLYEVPERHRSFRDRLRRAARLLGYAPLRAGLLIAPTDRSAQLHTLLARPPRGSQLLPARIELARADSRRLARELWELDGLAQEYRAHTTALQEALVQAERRPPTGAGALRGFAQALQPVYEAIGRDPLLPPELLPDDWPAAQLGTAFAATLRTLGPPALEYADSVRHRRPSVGSQVATVSEPSSREIATSIE